MIGRGHPQSFPFVAFFNYLSSPPVGIANSLMYLLPPVQKFVWYDKTQVHNRLICRLIFFFVIFTLSLHLHLHLHLHIFSLTYIDGEHH